MAVSAGAAPAGDPDTHLKPRPPRRDVRKEEPGDRGEGHDSGLLVSAGLRRVKLASGRISDPHRLRAARGPSFSPIRFSALRAPAGWWARQGSNLHGLLHGILSPARLPVPPRARSSHPPVATPFQTRRKTACPTLSAIALSRTAPKNAESFQRPQKPVALPCALGNLCQREQAVADYGLSKRSGKQIWGSPRLIQVVPGRWLWGRRRPDFASPSPGIGMAWLDKSLAVTGGPFDGPEPVLLSAPDSGGRPPRDGGRWE